MGGALSGSAACARGTGPPPAVTIREESSERSLRGSESRAESYKAHILGAMVKNPVKVAKFGATGSPLRAGGTGSSMLMHSSPKATTPLAPGASPDFKYQTMQFFHAAKNETPSVKAREVNATAPISAFRRNGGTRTKSVIQ